MTISNSLVLGLAPLGPFVGTFGTCPAAVSASTWSAGRRAASRCLERAQLRLRVPVLGPIPAALNHNRLGLHRRSHCAQERVRQVAGKAAHTLEPHDFSENQRPLKRGSYCDNANPRSPSPGWHPWGRVGPKKRVLICGAHLRPARYSSSAALNKAPRSQSGCDLPDLRMAVRIR